MNLTQAKEAISKKQDQINLIEAELSEKEADLEEKKSFTHKVYS